MALGGKLWVLGGLELGSRDSPGNLVNDIWYSEAPAWTPALRWELYR